MDENTADESTNGADGFRRHPSQRIRYVQIEYYCSHICKNSLWNPCDGSFAAGQTSDWNGHRFTVVVPATFVSSTLLMGLVGDYVTLVLDYFVAGVS